MAVSGRKISDFQGSVACGSAEDFEHSCDSCLADDQHVEAHGFCINCQEYLCKQCFRCHQRTKASKHHKLLDKNDMDKHYSKPAEVCTEKCSIHRNEIIKFFCPEHEDIGCTDCMTMNHRTCDLDYIPDTCAGIGDSDEYREIMKEIEEKIKGVDAVMKKAAVKDKEIDCFYDKVDEEFVTFRKEINDHLDTLHKTIATVANKKKLTNKQEIQAVAASCSSLASDMKKLQSTLQHNKAVGQNGQLFVDIKRAKSKFQSQQLEPAEFSLDKMKTQISFNRNKYLERILSTENFGQLTECFTAAAKARNTKPFIPLIHTADINVRKKSDKSTCCITGVAVLSSSKIVLADSNNNALKVVDIEKKAFEEEKKLASEPWDIAALPQDEIAVTLPDSKQILIMTAIGKLSICGSIVVNGQCRGVIYHQDCLYVVCSNPDNIYVLDMKGKIKNSISLADTAVFSFPSYLVLSQDHQLLYISSCTNDSIACVSLQGEITAVYRNKDLAGPRGMLVLDDGSLLVCCLIHTIHHVTADLKHGQEVMDGLSSPRSICYCADKRQVYVGGFDCDLIKIFDYIN